MRKLLLALTALIFLSVLFLVSVYIFLPQELIIAEATTIKASQYSIFRNLSTQENWLKWWPEKNNGKAYKDRYNYRGYSFKVTQLLYNALEVQIKNKDILTDGKIVMIPVTSDSILIHWQQVLSGASNPVSRIRRYRAGIEIKKTVGIILDSMKAFNEDKKRVYKFNIRHTTLKDTSLVATRRTTKEYPSVGVIYNMISHLRKYVAAEGAVETDYPMLNITKQAENSYATMVAIPTSKKLAGRGDIEFKRLIIYKDRVLAVDVKGGPATIDAAYHEMNTYLSDYKLDVPVIHFEYLVTDRSKETDTSKWVTKIYFPII